MTVWYACVACNRELYSEGQEYCAECWNAQRLRPDAYERELDRLYAHRARSADAPGVRVVISENEYSTEVEVFHGDERALYWDNRANVDYPEDLTWSREISEVFWAGVELGRKLAEGDKSMRKWAIRATREELVQEKIGGAFRVHEETEIVALFSTEEAAREYIKKATLKNPQRRRGGGWFPRVPAKVFRKASLLSGYDYAEVETWGEPDYPLDPEI